MEPMRSFVKKTKKILEEKMGFAKNFDFFEDYPPSFLTYPSPNRGK
jgi:hypothetical protein